MSLSKKGLKYGVPFMVLVVGGSFWLKDFASIRYQFRKTESIKPEDYLAAGVVKKEKPPTLEEEFEKVKQIDTEHWESIRGPRPWEEATLQQKQKSSN